MNTILKLTKGTIGMKLWGVTIGPCGINIHFGKKIRYEKFRCYHGEIDLLIETDSKVDVGKGWFYYSRHPQEKSEELQYRKLLNRKRVKDIKIRTNTNSLHILLNDGTVFSALLYTKRQNRRWSIYDSRVNPAVAISVYSNKIVRHP
jgi:hypothetical protein